MAFKFKTNAQDKYLLKPIVGKIDPGKKVQVTGWPAITSISFSFSFSIASLFFFGLSLPSCSGDDGMWVTLLMLSFLSFLDLSPDSPEDEAGGTSLKI